MAQTHDANQYYVPHHSGWPFLGSIALFTTMIGVANWMNGHAWGEPVFFLGLFMVLLVLGRWFGDVIAESLQGKYNAQVDASFRMGMMWFIFSEVMFFAAFFGALFYARTFALPWLSGEGDGVLTNQFLYPGYSAGWPANGPAAIGGSFETIPAWGLPLLNTMLLLSSGVTITLAHHALRAANRRGILWMVLAMTAFMGNSLRGLLLNAYAFWTIGTIALIAAITRKAFTNEALLDRLADAIGERVEGLLARRQERKEQEQDRRIGEQADLVMAGIAHDTDRQPHIARRRAPEHLLDDFCTAQIARLSGPRNMAEKGAGLGRQQLEAL